MPILPASPDSHAALLHSFFLYRTKVSPCSRRLTNTPALCSPVFFRPPRSVRRAPSPPHPCSLCVRRLPRPSRGGENSSSFRSSPVPPSSPHLCALRVLCGENSSSFCPSQPLRAVDSSRFELTLNLQLSTFNSVSFLSSPHLCALC